ncbi:type IV toxin-antitoxin system AbiEi family antitoxin domain-containing protein [Steroidobacter sp.]|uniref:type IV toxin-antitoxin system AbiEi family antitoxin domain-containing protein n=1 Tax=Steroidobacter sp. TaxID=1978227 RepID=UPI001A61B7A0|nr:type IV toxin-antitoxin system AbiEi family antitoxin domain-containing protein [Steroidobacter sp.]MBL8272033.1 type IV toxin-antitoxin system AbiEi family antitoxin [Steroidobacter sp.]
MGGNFRHQIIRRLQAELPRGAPFDLATLSQFGVSPQLAAHYAETGWLVRLAQGVYAFPNDDFGAYGALKLLQQRVPGLHIGGKSALALQGVRHNLGSRDRLVLWGDNRYVLPTWYTSRFPARYVHARLFDWPDTQTALAGKTLTTTPGLPDDLRVAVPERAVLELLYEVGVKESLEEARNVFDGLRSPRKDMVGQLLSCCTSVKTVRLFLTWARETNLVDVDGVLKQYPVRIGSATRWMSRLHDGTLLSLKPHG